MRSEIAEILSPQTKGTLIETNICRAALTRISLSLHMTHVKQQKKVPCSCWRHSGIRLMPTGNCQTQADRLHALLSAT